MWLNLNYMVALGLQKQNEPAAAQALMTATIDVVSKYYELYGGKQATRSMLVQHPRHFLYVSRRPVPPSSVYSIPTYPGSVRSLANPPPPTPYTVIFEFYDADDTHDPRSLLRKRSHSGGIRDYHWSAALTFRMLLELHNAPRSDQRQPKRSLTRLHHIAGDSVLDSYAREAPSP